MRQLGQIAKPVVRGSAHVDLLIQHGGEHERDYVQKLKDEGKQVVVIPDRGEITFDEARQQTLDALVRQQRLRQLRRARNAGAGNR